MPRKAKPRPIPLVVEDIATGERLGSEGFVDDFTGQAMPLAAVAKPAKGRATCPRPIPQQLRNRLHEAKLAQARALLEATGILPKPLQGPKLVAPYRPGMRYVATLGGHGVYVRMPPWR